MTTTAGHSFYIGPIGSFYNQVNDTGSWEPLVYLWDTCCVEINHFMMKTINLQTEDFNLTVINICVSSFLSSKIFR
jgi:hypothetical protein